MRTRCLDPSYHCFHRYGGRGIKAFERWNDFRNFLADMGERPPGRSLDRKDGDGDYTPENCRWATREEQAANRVTTIIITHNGVSLPLTKWAEKIGVKAWTLRYRRKAGWPVERLLSPAIGGK